MQCGAGVMKWGVARCVAVWCGATLCMHALVLVCTFRHYVHDYVHIMCGRSGAGAVRAWIHYVRDYVRELARARVRANVCVRVGVA